MSTYAPEGVSLIPDTTELHKDPDKGHIGVAIGGGAPTCKTIYVVQVFDNSPCSKDGKISVGDEVVAINGKSVRGMAKSSVADLIRNSTSPICISFNRLQFQPERGRTLDILFKKIKHWVVESIDSKTADKLGLSRAVLCNDVLQKLLERLDANENFYKQLNVQLNGLLRNYIAVSNMYNELGALYGQVAVRELSPKCVNFFTNYANTQSLLHKEHLQFLSIAEKLIDSIQSYVKNAIPDVRLSLSKYMNAKFEYLSYCLKIKEMEDEEVEMAEYDEYPGRMENGNYEYRVMLKCRELSRTKFIDMRNHVQIKIQLLDQKQVLDLPQQLRGLIAALRDLNNNCRKILRNSCNDMLKNIVIDRKAVDNELTHVIHHLNLDDTVDDVLANVECLPEIPAELQKRSISIPYWRDNRIHATWPPDEADEAFEENEKDEDQPTESKVEKSEPALVEENLIDFSGPEDDGFNWGIVWETEESKDTSNEIFRLEDLLPQEWTHQNVQSVGNSLNLESDRQFHSTDSETLLVDL